MDSIYAFDMNSVNPFVMRISYTFVICFVSRHKYVYQIIIMIYALDTHQI